MDSEIGQMDGGFNYLYATIPSANRREEYHYSALNCYRLELGERSAATTQVFEMGAQRTVTISCKDTNQVAP